MVRARLEPDLKEHTEEIFNKLGLSVTQAITLFYKQVEIFKALAIFWNFYKKSASF